MVVMQNGRNGHLGTELESEFRTKSRVEHYYVLITCYRNAQITDTFIQR